MSVNEKYRGQSGYFMNLRFRNGRWMGWVEADVWPHRFHWWTECEEKMSGHRVRHVCQSRLAPIVWPSLVHFDSCAWLSAVSVVVKVMGNESVIASVSMHSEDGEHVGAEAHNVTDFGEAYDELNRLMRAKLEERSQTNFLPPWQE